MKLRNLDRRMVTVLLIVFVQIVGAGLILPILPLYARGAFGMSDRWIPVLVASFFAAQFLAGPYLGRLSDRHGRIPVLILSQIGTVLSFIVLGAAETTWLLFASRILDGATGGNIIVVQAYITDITPREKRAQSLGYVFAAFGLGFIVGPAAGGALTRLFGPRIPFFIAAGAATIVVLMTWRFLEETVTDEERGQRRGEKAGLDFGEVIRNGALMTALFIAFLGQFGLGLLQATFALYGEDRIFIGFQPENIAFAVGALLAVVGLTQFLTQVLLLRRLLSWLGEARLVIGGTLIRAGGLLLFGVAALEAVRQLDPALGTLELAGERALPPILLAVLGSILFPLGMGTMMPPLQSMTTATVGDEVRGNVLGLYQSAISLATIFGTGLAGFLYAIAPSVPYWAGAILSVLTALPAIALMRMVGKRVDADASPRAAVGAGD